MPVSHRDKISPYARLLDQSAERARMLARCKGTERAEQFLNGEYIAAGTTDCGHWLALYVMLT